MKIVKSEKQISGAQYINDPMANAGSFSLFIALMEARNNNMDVDIITKDDEEYLEFTSDDKSLEEKFNRHIAKMQFSVFQQMATGFMLQKMNPFI